MKEPRCYKCGGRLDIRGGESVGMPCRKCAREHAAQQSPDRCACCDELYAPHHAKIYVGNMTWHRDEENCGREETETTTTKGDTP